MFKKILSSLLISLLVCTNSTFAISWDIKLTLEKRKSILEKFQEQEINNIFNNTDFFSSEDSVSLINSSNKIDLYSSLRSKAETKRQYLEDQNIMLIERVNSLEKSIQILDNDIQGKITEVNDINFKIVETKKDIESGKKVISFLRKKIIANRKTLLEYITYIYKKWNYSFEEWKMDNIKSIIMNWEDIWEVINDLHFKAMIEITGQKLIEKHREYEGILYVKKLELENNQKSLILLRNSMIIEKKVLDDKKEFKKRVLEITKWKEGLYKKYVDDKLAIEKSIKLKELKESIVFKNTKNKLLSENNCEFIDLDKDEEKLYSMTDICIKLNKIIYSESKLQKLDYIWSNPFVWPLTPAYWVSSYFQDERYKKEIWAEHNAIDIVIPQWTSVKAAADWYVVYLNSPKNEDYAYVAIKHSDWFVTVYGHLNEVFVNQYDFVKQWEVFAKSWWEYGTNWAWILTTWAHLHFEVFQNKDYVDPLEFLDTSYLKLANVPEKYKYKYLNDFKLRKWYEYKDVGKQTKWFSLDWFTEVERQKSLLNKYAVGWFRDWNLWVEESLDWNIDPTFVMCIWIAETWLWRYTKTENNVWNVWNTDSWATKTMMSARDWVRSMIFTLNNKYLWKYQEIRELSRYWNKIWSIYASSDYNWHNNIIKCMSSIKQKYVPDDYNYRL